MAGRIRYTFFMDPDVREALREIKRRDGIPESEQLRRAIREWITHRVITKTERKRAVTRKRP